ncbi:hypothetical protein ASPFODRAFT_49054 [Aspergillus luchuensis CBS 106.47]|uniref:Uncharacterized protein n=1 Tax=Aspergillus luchuensis (strain CBS 106.47) TaxID=1137211 RepID=A0A1M3TA62_ASPLC|nr:hypothetical protein ASPFODRAFT_49054 [Aspergillus luchuensis CBS 106.47]
MDDAETALAQCRYRSSDTGQPTISLGAGVPAISLTWEISNGAITLPRVTQTNKPHRSRSGSHHSNIPAQYFTMFPQLASADVAVRSPGFGALTNAPPNTAGSTPCGYVVPPQILLGAILL